MAKYNRYQRTTKYSDEFKATAVLLSHLDECTVKSVAESGERHPKKVATISRGTKAEKFQFIERYIAQLEIKRLCLERSLRGGKKDLSQAIGESFEVILIIHPSRVFP